MRRLAWSIFYLFVPGLMLGGLIGSHMARSSWANQQHEKALNDQIALLQHNLESHRHRRATEDRYNIRITGAAGAFTDNTNGWSLGGQPLAAQQVLDALPDLLGELDRYPVDVIHAAGLQRIVLCGALSEGEVVVGGLADHESGTIYLTIPNWSPADGAWLRRSLHHEMYHLIDATRFPAGAGDPSWSDLNEKAFHYGNGGIHATTEMRSNVLTDRWPGFVTAYSRSAIEEDKAEVFASMMAEMPALADRMRTDPIVAAKVKLIRQRCRELSPGFNP